MASTGVQVDGQKVRPVYAKPVPEFQVLPPSISKAQFIQPTIVEYYPKDDDLPVVDLKGHTVEELAAAANVPVETIKAAIKLRQQQMLVEKKTSIKPKWKKAPATKTTLVQTTQSTTSSESTEELTTQSTTSTTPYVPKKKVVKKTVKNGHKVRFICEL
jgi:hypothetical protein